MKRQAQPGSVSHGTMRQEDLIPRFLMLLSEHGVRVNTTGMVDVIQALRRNRDLSDDQSERASFFLNETLFDALQEIAPEGHYFGSHPGDGSDYGFWPDEEENPKFKLRKPESTHGYPKLTRKVKERVERRLALSDFAAEARHQLADERLAKERQMKRYRVSVMQETVGRPHIYIVRASSSEDAQQLAFALDGGWSHKDRDASEMLALAQAYASAFII